jgi:Major Facilitator Superfamily
MRRGRGIVRRAAAAVGWWEPLCRPGSHRPLAANGVISAAGSGLALIVLPFYALVVLHLGAAQLGLALGLGGAVELFCTAPAGALAAKVGIRRFTVAVRIARGAVYLLLAFAGSFSAFLVLVACDGALRAANVGLTQALTAAAVGERERVSVVALVRSMRNVGYLLGAGVGALALALGSDEALRLALAANGLSFLADALIVARLRMQSERAPARPDALAALRDPQYMALVGCGAVFGSSYVILDVALPLWVLHHSQLPRWSVAAAVALNTTMVVALQYRLAAQTREIDSALRALRTATIAFIAAAAFIALSGQLIGGIALVALLLGAAWLTFGEMTESSAWWVFSFELAPSGRRTEYLASFDLGRGVVNMVGPPLAAAIAGGWFLSWGFYAAAVVAAGACAFSIIRRRLPSALTA